MHFYVDFKRRGSASKKSVKKVSNCTDILFFLLRNSDHLGFVVACKVSFRRNCVSEAEVNIKD